MTAEHLAIDNYACPHCRAVFRTAFQRCPLDGNPLEPLVGDPLAGSSFADRYIIEECVGEGGMGRVYRARHQRMSRRFAIKVLFGDHAADSKMQARLAREAEAASRLSHPNVISVLDFGETPEGLLYLVMDYVAGPTLAALIEDQAPLARHRVVKLVRDMARGLAHAHKVGLIHRDFKADNVIISGEGPEETAKIVDFGIAQLNEPNKSRKLTTEGMVLGTPAVMAPEQAVGEAVDNRTDLFSLGIVMYEMLCGKLPFDGSPLEIARQNLANAPPRISERVPGLMVDPELEGLAVNLMAKRPEDRPQDAKVVLRALSRMDGENSMEFRRSEGSFLESAGLDPMTPLPQSFGADPAISFSDASTPDYHHEYSNPGLHADAPQAGFTPAPAAGLTEMVPVQRRKSTAVWLLAFAAVALLAVVVAIVAQAGGGDEQTAAALPDAGAQEPTAVPLTEPLDAGAALAVADAAVATIASPDASTARSKPPLTAAEKRRAERERKRIAKRLEKKLERKRREREAKEREARRKAAAEAKAKADAAAAAAAAAAEAKKVVTPSQFQKRFAAVGRLLGRLDRLDSAAASGPKRLYSSVQSNLANAMKSESTRKRMYKTLASIRSMARKRLAAAEKRKATEPAPSSN